MSTERFLTQNIIDAPVTLETSPAKYSSYLRHSIALIGCIVFEVSLSVRSRI